jgi:Protein of unknown function (DUF3551)
MRATGFVSSWSLAHGAHDDRGFSLILGDTRQKGGATMRVIALVLVGLAINTFAATESDAAASNAWCATYSRQGGVSENCGYATLAQCRAQVLGLGGWCRPNPLPGTAFGTGGTWSSGPPRQQRRGYYGY